MGNGPFVATAAKGSSVEKMREKGEQIKKAMPNRVVIIKIGNKEVFRK
jgi:hypothetical protein